MLNSKRAHKKEDKTFEKEQKSRNHLCHSFWRYEYETKENAKYYMTMILNRSMR